MSAYGEECLQKIARGGYIVGSFKLMFGVVVIGVPTGVVAGAIALTGIGVPFSMVIVALWAFAVVFSPILAPILVWYIKRSSRIAKQGD